MNPISGVAPSKPAPQKTQDIALPQSPPTGSPTQKVDMPVQPEIVSGLSVKAPDVLPPQTQLGAESPPVANPVIATTSYQSTHKDDKDMDKVLKNVNQQIRKDDNKGQKASLFKRWEFVIIAVVTSVVVAALCLCAVFALK